LKAALGLVWGGEPMDARGRAAQDRPAMTACSAHKALARLLALVLAMSFAAGARAAPVTLDHARDYIVDLAPYTQVYFDDSLQRTIGQLHAMPHVFAPVTTSYIDFGLTDARIWLRLQLYNPAPERGAWRLDLRRQYVQELVVYVVRRGAQPEILLSHGRYDAFGRRPIVDRYLATDVTLAGREVAEVFVAYRARAATWMPMKLSSLEAYAAAHAAEERINWLLNGALLAMIAVMLLMVPVIGWRLCLAVCFYAVSGFFFVFHAEGYTFQHLWPDRAGLNTPLGLTFLLMMALSGPIFARILFDTWARFPVFDRLLRAGIAIAGVLALASIPLFDVTAFKLVAYPFIVITAALQFTTGILAYRASLLGATPFLIGSTLVVASLVFALFANTLPGRIDLELTLDVGHVTLLTEAIAFAAAVVIRVLGLRRERDAALRAELAAARDKLRLDAALRDAQAQYDAARTVAERRRMQLSSVGHDIRQPITALRSALSKLTDADSAAARQVSAAFDYLEDLARSKVETEPDEARASQADDAVEKFPIRAVLDNVSQMFAPEAAAKGLAFRYRPLDVAVKTEPLALMRLVNNLVANAVKHTKTGGVMLAARRRDGEASIEVRDTGPGMNEENVKAALEPFHKGAESTGDGLGLAIVSEQSERLGYRFALRSKPGRGTAATLRLPIAE
jgi:signal transduction histidine kinase